MSNNVGLTADQKMRSDALKAAVHVIPQIIPQTEGTRVAGMRVLGIAEEFYQWVKGDA